LGICDVRGAEVKDGELYRCGLVSLIGDRSEICDMRFVTFVI